MGDFCSVRDVRLALTPNASSVDKETAAVLPDWQIEDAISEAEGIVRAHLQARYTIPTAEVAVVNPDDPGETWIFQVAPFPVRGWVRDIAAYLATLTFRRNKDLAEDDPMRLRFQMVMEMLRSVRDYAMNLPADQFPAAPEDASRSGVFVENTYDGKLFGLEDLGLGPEAPSPAYQVYWPLYYG